MIKSVNIIALLLIAFSTFAQVEEELGFQYVKAEYLIETGRYEDAIEQFSEIIRIEPGFKEALLKRAEAKYATSNWRGVKDDAVNYIKRKGASAEAIYYLGLAESKLGNYEAAANSLNSAITLIPGNPELHYERGMAMMSLGDESQACTDWQAANEYGHRQAHVKLRKNCNGVAMNTNDNAPAETKPSSGSTRPNPRPKTSTGSKPKGEPTTTSTGQANTKPQPKTSKSMAEAREEASTQGMENTQEKYEDEVYVETIPEAPKQPYDDSVNTIEVDDDLTLYIKNGLGGSKILDQPNILILSETAGVVAIDICINKRGRVESAELNRAESTLQSQSIISLATRKAQEFWFEKSEWEETCGTILFEIAGR